MRILSRQYQSMLLYIRVGFSLPVQAPFFLICTSDSVMPRPAAPFCRWDSTVSRLQSHKKEAVYFLPLTSQKFPVLIWSTSERWIAEPTLEPPCGFEHGMPGLGIQHLSHYKPLPELTTDMYVLIYQLMRKEGHQWSKSGEIVKILPTQTILCQM